jgi:hypothetical protein
VRGAGEDGHGREVVRIKQQFLAPVALWQPAFFLLANTRLRGFGCPCSAEERSEIPVRRIYHMKAITVALAVAAMVMLSGCCCLKMLGLDPCAKPCKPAPCAVAPAPCKTIEK